jgi:glycosyltransferase involved in cell wall biosynthesis
MLKTCLILPAYNEAPVLKKVLEDLLQASYSVILVDDGSTDDTFHIASSFPVTLIRHQINLGQGAALETGMEAARILNADFVIHFDADGQHEVTDIERLLKPVQDGKADITFGSRFLEQNAGIPRSRKIILNLARWINYVITGILLSDAHNGFRAMNKKAISEIRLEYRGMAHATEILEKVRKHSLKYMEVPVHIRYTDYSKKKGQNFFDGINILFQLLFKRN